MNSLKDIKKPLAEDLKSFRKVFRNAVKSRVPLLDVIMRYILKSKGKQIRPLFVFFSAGLLGNINDKTYRAATLVELLHTATLVHDDVVDSSFHRRGRFSINFLWRNKIAVLAGDYLLSRGMLVALENKDYDTLEIVSRAVKDMSEGELLQLEKARRLDIDEEVYYEIIRKKTASLIASCCAVGAASVSSDEATVQKMRTFGETLGMAFQIKDDLFDYQSSAKTGKPSGIDIKEQKMTLPLIYALNNATWLEKRKIIGLIKNHHDNPEKVQEVIAFVMQSGGLEFAEERMKAFKKEALEILYGFQQNEYRDSLEALVDYVIKRKK
jgi:octaprenyl-diphosphate synthase